MKDVALPRLSNLEILILDLLTEHREMYGLEMVEASRRQLKRGSIYVTLNRMEDKGFVSSREVEGEGQGPPRMKYRVTGHGARVLAAWQMAGAVYATGVRP